jgi:alpha-beta hydrolase superfamily lysophospholipase
MSHWTWEYVPDAASVVGGLTPAQIDQVEGLAARIADAADLPAPVLLPASARPPREAADVEFVLVGAG